MCTGIAQSHDIGFTARGEMIVTDNSSDCVRVFDVEGSVSRMVLGDVEGNVKKLIRPYALLVRAGNVYVLDHTSGEVMVYT